MVIAGIDAALLYTVGIDYENYLGWRNFIGNALMLQNYLGPFQGVPAYGSGGHLWSLAVEFHIYLFVGAFVFVVLGRQRWLGCLLAVVSAPMPLVFFSGESHGLPGTGLFILWLLGFAIYYICRAGLGRGIPVILLVVATTAFCMIWLRRTVPGNEYRIENYTIVAMAFLSLVMATQRMRLFSKIPVWRNWARFAANYSFSLYLLHHSILFCVSRIWPSGAEFGALSGILISNAVAIPFAYYTEFRHKALAAWLRNGVAKVYSRLSCGAACR